MERRGSPLHLHVDPWRIKTRGHYFEHNTPGAMSYEGAHHVSILNPVSLTMLGTPFQPIRTYWNPGEVTVVSYPRF